MKVKSLSRVRLLATPMDCSLPGSSVHGIFQARVPEWVAIAFSETYAMGLLLLLSFLCSFLCYCSQERQVRWQPLARTKDGSLSQALAWRDVFTRLIRLSTPCSAFSTLSWGLLTFLRIYTELSEVLNYIFFPSFELIYSLIG